MVESSIQHCVNPINRTASCSNSEPHEQLVAVLNITRGVGPLVATCDVKLGGVLIRGVRVRRGRGGMFVNMPSVRDRETGAWTQIVELNPHMADLARQAVERAVTAALAVR